MFETAIFTLALENAKMNGEIAANSCLYRQLLQGAGNMPEVLRFVIERLNSPFGAGNTVEEVKNLASNIAKLCKIKITVSKSFKFEVKKQI